MIAGRRKNARRIQARRRALNQIKNWGGRKKPDDSIEFVCAWSIKYLLLAARSTAKASASEKAAEKQKPLQHSLDDCSSSAVLDAATAISCSVTSALTPSECSTASYSALPFRACGPDSACDTEGAESTSATANVRHASALTNADIVFFTFI